MHLGEVSRRKSHGLGIYSNANGLGLPLPRIENQRRRPRLGKRNYPPPPLFCRPPRAGNNPRGGVPRGKILPVGTSPRATPSRFFPWSLWRRSMAMGAATENPSQWVGVRT